jgi:integrase
MSRIPNISHVEEVILAELRRGPLEARSLQDILREEYGHTENPSSFFRRVGRLIGFNLIELEKSRTISPLVRQQSVYSLTEQGVKYHARTKSFYLRIANSDRPDEDLPGLSQPGVVTEMAAVRTATAEEVQEIERNASHEFASIFRVVYEIGVSVTSLAAADIRDFDPKNETLSIRRQSEVDSHSLSSIAMKRVKDCASGRKSGPLFLTSTGHEWSETNLRQSFMRIKRKLNLDREVVMQMARIRRTPR